MQVEIMKKFLDTLNFQIRKKKRNVILLLANTAVPPTLFIDMYSNIKIVFLPKNTTSRLRPLDAGISTKVPIEVDALHYCTYK